MMIDFTDIVLVSKKHNFLRIFKLPKHSFIVTCVILFGIIASTVFLSSYNAREIFVAMSARKSECENESLINRLDSLNNLVALTHRDFDRHIEQDNRERTYWQMVFVHPDVWSMGIGGSDAKAPEKALSDRANGILNQLYESLDVLKGKCELRDTSLNDIIQKMESKVYLWSHIPSINPVPGRRLGSGFGYRVDPINKKMIKMHWGLDIGAPRGTDILASADGVVSYTGWNRGYGLCLDIDHGFGFKTRYAHCNCILVKKGDFVKRSQVIATIGDTGRTTCPHLHYEVHVSGVKVDPKPYIDLSNVVVD
jgi:murein DD-endopeptidase MepM/ murein hydrolase activator NlpD